MISIQDCRILSIQSHVVSGYVGNKCIAFPLQILGFDVDTVDTVQFSNHTGYPVWKGQVTDTEDFEAILSNLDTSVYTHVMTGYVTSAALLERIRDLVTEMKRANPEVVYVCDPVMGDNGFLYVPAELVPIYKRDLLPMADIVTPNQFESELLTGITIRDEPMALDAMEALHVMGATSVVITSTTVDGNASTLVVFASKRTGDRMTSLRVDVPRIDANFCGTGDLFSAILVGWMTKSNNNLRVSVEKTVSTIQAVLKKTYRHAQNMHTDQSELKYNSHELELRLVQSKDEIEEPPQNFKSVALT
ncbi:pyridoxal kinase-like [Amblyomma americanum]|uniref:Pyridoxal kinase n=1 Tax=Amblyomma americanum TaxID=6943 RepID=A0AAQ4E8U4_AMBAM